MDIYIKICVYKRGRSGHKIKTATKTIKEPFVYEVFELIFKRYV